jgi:hypothetical protein
METLKFINEVIFIITTIVKIIKIVKAIVKN